MKPKYRFTFDDAVQTIRDTPSSHPKLLNDLPRRTQPREGNKISPRNEEGEGEGEGEEGDCLN